MRHLRPRRRVHFELLEERQVLAVLLPGESVYPTPRSIIEYGGSVELDGDRAFVGDVGEDALFIMRRVGDIWQTEAVIEPPGRLDFPYAVIAAGDLLVAESMDRLGEDGIDRYARLFELQNGQWQEVLSVKCFNEVKSVSVSPAQFSCGRRVFIRDDAQGWIEDARKSLPDYGHLQGDRFVSSSGAVVVYEYQAGGWQSQQTLSSAGVAAIDGDSIIVANELGTVTLFNSQEQRWSSVATFPFKASRVWIEGDTAVAADSSNGMVYERVDGVWRERGDFDLENSSSGKYSIAIEQGQVLVSGNNDAYFLTAGLQAEGNVWNDLNQNGIHGATETAAAGIEVQLRD